MPKAGIGCFAENIRVFGDLEAWLNHVVAANSGEFLLAGIGV